MKVLIANKFLHHVGGVETYVAWLARHLPERGIDVAFFGMAPPDGADLMSEVRGEVFLTPNRDYHGSLPTRVRSAATSVYASAAGKLMGRALDIARPDLVHFHGTCYQLTPAVVAAASRWGASVATTAHEYKFVCSNQRLWNDAEEAPCIRCLDATTLRRVANIATSRCVKGSLASSLVSCAELPIAQRVWSRSNGLVHAPSRFMERVLNGEGSPVKGRVRYLDLAWGERVTRRMATPDGSERVTYIGRLSREKGVDLLLAAWPKVLESRPHATLELYGSGPDEDRLRALARSVTRITFHGRYELDALAAILDTASLTVHPSRWAENSPYTVRESLEFGIPVVVSDQGGLPEMVAPATGTVFKGGDVDSLADAILRELSASRKRTDEFYEGVERRFVSNEQHLDALIDLYSDAQAQKAQR